MMQRARTRVRATLTRRPTAVRLEQMHRRLELVRKRHEHKRTTGMPLRDPGREEAMVASLQGRNEGPLSDDGVASLVAFLLGLTRKELYGE